MVKTVVDSWEEKSRQQERDEGYTPNVKELAAQREQQAANQKPVKTVADTWEEERKQREREMQSWTTERDAESLRAKEQQMRNYFYIALVVILVLIGARF